MQSKIKPINFKLKGFIFLFNFKEEGGENVKGNFLEILVIALWMFLFSYVSSYVPKNIWYLIIGFPVAFAGLFIILWLFRGKAQKED